MTTPDVYGQPFPDKNFIWIDKGQGIIGENYGKVVQNIINTPPEKPVDLKAAEDMHRRRVIDTYNSLNFSGFERNTLLLSNVSLEQIFVRLTLTVEKSLSRREREEGLQGGKRGSTQPGESSIFVEEPINLDQALRNDLLLVGEPGAGKTTLLRWLAVTFAKRHLRLAEDRVGPAAERGRLPILVELGRLPRVFLKPDGSDMSNWLDFLPQYIPGQMAFHGIPAQLLKKALDEGRCLLLFDGLDEIADRLVRKRIAESLAVLKRSQESRPESERNRILIGSRTTGADENERYLRQYQRCQIARFTPEDVQGFFDFWYTKVPGLTDKQKEVGAKRAEALWNKVKATPSLLQLATTPLLATILLVIWHNDGTLPEHRIKLYTRCCRGLLEDWEPNHNVFQQGILARLTSWKEHLRLLAPLAFAIHSGEQRTSAISSELTALLARELQAQRLVSNADAAIREARQCLEELSLRSGLLQRIGDEYSFLHHTFQEYLTACYIATLPQAECTKLVMEHLPEAWWQQVHLLVMGYLGSWEPGRAQELFLEILHQYPPPAWYWDRPRVLRSAALGRRFPGVALERRITWVLGRNLTLCLRGLRECAAKDDPALQPIGVHLKNQVLAFIQQCLRDKTDRQLSAFLSYVDGALPERENAALLFALSAILRDTEQDEYVRAAVARGLGQLGVGQKFVIETLQATLAYPRSLAVADAVAESLGEVVARDAAEIRKLWNDLYKKENSFLSVYRAIALGKAAVGNKAIIEQLVARLRHQDEHIRFGASLALEQMETRDPKVIDALLDALHNEPDKGVRRNLVQALGKVEGKHTEVIEALLVALDDPDGTVHEYVYESLGRVGRGNVEVINKLLRIVVRAGRATWEKRGAIESLGQVGAGNEQVLSTLLMILERPYDYIQEEESAHMLPEMRELLTALGNSHDDIQVSAMVDLQRAAARSLGQVGAGHEQVITVLLAFLRDSRQSERTRSAAVESLGQLGAGKRMVIEALLNALHTYCQGVFYEKDIRAAAARSLGQLGVGDRQVMSALLEALNDSSETIREAAAKSLGQVAVGDRLPHDVLLALNRCWYDPDDKVSSAAITAMGQVLEGRSLRNENR